MVSCPARRLQTALRGDDTERMVSSVPQRSTTDDPRKLRELLARSESLASDHGLPSVIMGLAGHEGDLLLPDLFFACFDLGDIEGHAHQAA